MAPLLTEIRGEEASHQGLNGSQTPGGSSRVSLLWLQSRGRVMSSLYRGVIRTTGGGQGCERACLDVIRAEESWSLLTRFQPIKGRDAAGRSLAG